MHHFLPVSTLLSVFLLLSFYGAHAWAGAFPVLVDSKWLSENKTDVVILDVRTRKEYMNGHWPNARWAGFKQLQWQVDRYDLPGYLPSKKQLSSLLGVLGLRGSEAIVVMGSAGHPEFIAQATRVLWTLKMAGFNDVALLDGGIESLPVNALVFK